MERWYPFSHYARQHYGHRLYRIPLDIGCTCPNRDGTISYGGCIFCDAGGSGDFAYPYSGQPLPNPKYRNPGECIAYFESYSNTYGQPVEKLEYLYRKALEDPLTAGIVIATRPDCLKEPILSCLKQLKEEYTNKFIWLEFGLQTRHESTAKLIRRGYPLATFEKAMLACKALNLPVIVHVILFLPGETREMMLETIRYLNAWHPFGIKIHYLEILRGTPLETLYQNGEYKEISKEEYLDVITEVLGTLDPSTIIFRLTSDSPKELIVSPHFGVKKAQLINEIRHTMKEKRYIQGCLCTEKKKY